MTIYNLFKNDKLVKTAYSDFLQHTTQLYSLSIINNQEVIIDAKTIGTAQTLFTSLAQSVKSEKLSNEFNQFANSLNIAEGKELKDALQMIDDYK